jgi:hypothetical protein
MATMSFLLILSFGILQLACGYGALAIVTGRATLGRHYALIGTRARLVGALCIAAPIAYWSFMVPVAYHYFAQFYPLD